jgi:7-carboxy-7-deazaguanine synthase (Cx14CxxC type)
MEQKTQFRIKKSTESWFYSLRESFLSIQGEGVNAGRVAVFLRFSGCNLWTGLEEDREKAVCRFCDTQFVGHTGAGGGVFESPRALVNHVKTLWPSDSGQLPFVVCTGGEPLLQVDEALIAAFKAEGFFIALETNGTLPGPAGFDWVCVSPKAGTRLVITQGDELKLVFPQKGVDPRTLLSLRFRHFVLQPLDNERVRQNTQRALEYCLTYPVWRLGVQLHKALNVR